MTTLPQKWAVWEHRQRHPDDKVWMDQFYKLAPLCTAEDYWAYATHYPKPSTLFRGPVEGLLPPAIKRGFRTSRVLGIILMKDPVTPETKARKEDGTKWTGDRYIMNVECAFQEVSLWDTVMEILMLACIGGTVSSDVINGVWVANRTKVDSAKICLRVEVWFDTAASADQVERSVGVLEEAVNSHTDVRLALVKKE